MRLNEIHLVLRDEVLLIFIMPNLILNYFNYYN